ncbi:hypothetical protein D3C80_949830 [compost metagenome]
MFARAQHGFRHRIAGGFVLDGVDGGAGCDLAHQGQFAAVVGRFNRLGTTAALDDAGLEAGMAARCACCGLFRQLGHFQRAGAVGQAADEAALLQRRDQAVDARLGRQIQRLLHLVEGGRDARFLNPFVNEHQEFVLLLGEHGRKASRTRREPLSMFCKCSCRMSTRPLSLADQLSQQGDH